MVINTTNSFAKTICSICYEDLKPNVEDLQAISICGHVFHELCLQQWFEYCSSAKKCSCPVCKQSCSASNVSRLYFQSVGDQKEPSVSQKVTDFNCEENLQLLRGEVKRLEDKASGLGSTMERQGKEIKQLNEELYLCKDQLKKEVMQRNDAMKQKASIQQLLLSKSEELDTLKLERLRLQDRSMALAKELAALKLASDLNLEEDEVLKLASFGNEANSKDTIDILRKSLVIRNKSYKELMAKCSQLGRGEASSCKRLEKAKEKINKLKTRVQELERVVEVKDNEALRALTASKKINCKGFILNGTNDCPTALPSCEKEQHSISVDYLCQTEGLTNDKVNFNFINDMGANSYKECTSSMGLKKERNTGFTIDEAASELSTAGYVLSDPDLKHPTREHAKSPLAKSGTLSDINGEGKVQGIVNPGGFFGIRTSIDSDKVSALGSAIHEEVTLPLDEIGQIQPCLNIKKGSSSAVPLSKPGDICFTSGLLAPDGTNRYLGKWCKRGQSKGSLDMQGTSPSSGDLIAVGSDGRGGRIKVLRSLNQSSLDARENSVSTKRCKHGTKASSLQSQGCLQIEHFFGKASQ